MKGGLTGPPCVPRECHARRRVGAPSCNGYQTYDRDQAIKVIAMLDHLSSRPKLLDFTVFFSLLDFRGATIYKRGRAPTMKRGCGKDGNQYKNRVSDRQVVM
jgi:hypothetical protein